MKRILSVGPLLATMVSSYESVLRFDPRLAGAKTSLDKLESRLLEKQS